MPNLLTDIILNEVSLVDSGANEDAKVLLFKRNGDTDMSKELEKKIVDLTKSLDELTKAGEIAKTDSEKLNETVKTLTESVETEKAKATEALEALEKIKNPGKDIDKKKLPEEVQKILDDQAAINKAQAEENTKQAEEIAKLKDNELTKSLQIEVAKFDKLSLDKEKTVKLFKSLDLENSEFLTETLKTINEVVSKGNLFKELGGNGGDDNGSATEKVNKKAEALMKDDSSLTIQAARTMIWKTDKDLKKQYDSERKNSH